MVFQHAEYDRHEKVVFLSDNTTGRSAIIENLQHDARPCSRWLPLDGGKSVIVVNPATDKTPELLAAFARAVTELNSSY